LQTFISTARDFELYSGLAGSLREDDIDELTQLTPHFLGFRGALCDESDRGAALSPERVQRVRAELDRVRVQAPDPCDLSPK
jgi:dihydroneopterin aldolase